jgi:phosphoribosylamine---glycine ligase
MAGFDILIVGGGGRENALAWKLAQSPHTGKLYLAPGNAGTTTIGQNLDIQPEDLDALFAFAQANAIGLTVIGPEAPLAEGIVDLFQASGLQCFGPVKAAARLEASKDFAKNFMQENGIPTAAYASFTDYEEARHYLARQTSGVVIKADGLAAGKGVFVCDTFSDADNALQSILKQKAFGQAGNTVIIEERLTGPEVSILAFCDGVTAALMPPARDYKRVFDRNQGNNTGGMGAFAPVPDVDAVLLTEIDQRVIGPTLRGMAARGTPYKGILYAGLMLTPDGMRVLEFNCRFGDPETQVLLPLLNSDLVEIMQACIDGTLAEKPVHWRDDACATIVLASPGYPDNYPKGLVVHGLETATDELMIFHAGTTLNNAGQIVTSGGRVLAISAYGSTPAAAAQAVYSHLESNRSDRIYFENMHFRTDIAQPPAPSTGKFARLSTPSSSS